MTPSGDRPAGGRARFAMDKANTTLAVVAAARALLAAPAGDREVRRRLAEVLDAYDGGTGRNASS
jgi:hypothetical protein